MCDFIRNQNNRQMKKGNSVCKVLLGCRYCTRSSRSESLSQPRRTEHTKRSITAHVVDANARLSKDECMRLLRRRVVEGSRRSVTAGKELRLSFDKRFDMNAQLD